MATAASTHSVPVRSREASTTRIADVASYWLIIGATYMTFGFLFYYAAKEKLFDDSGTMPTGLAKGFHGSFIASFPGVNACWTLLGLLEGLVFLVLEARSAGTPWLEFNVIRTDSRGRFNASYRFRLAGPHRYRFRIIAKYEADFPFIAGASNAVLVEEQ
jgi:hypothetical protein